MISCSVIGYYPDYLFYVLNNLSVVFLTCCFIAILVCKKDFMHCNKSSCIARDYACDGYMDCDNGVDEMGCSKYKHAFILFHVYCSHVEWVGVCCKLIYLI